MRSVDRALDVIALIAGAIEPVSLASITRHLGLPRTTAFSIVKTLANRGMLTLVDGKGYQLGPMVNELVRAYRPPRNLIERAHRWLEEISRKTQETAFLAIPVKNEILFIDKVETSQAIRYSAQVGTRRPLYCTAHGKLALALRDDDEIERYLSTTELVRRTDKTFTDAVVLRKELEKIRRQGFAVSNGEFSVDAYSISAPVTAGSSGQLIAMISAVGPTMRMRPQRREMAEFLVSIAAKLSAECEGLQPMTG